MGFYELLERLVESKITITKDSFGKKLWKVEYIRMGKKRYRTYYSKEEAENFLERGAPALKDEPIVQPRKQTRRSREVPKW